MIQKRANITAVDDPDHVLLSVIDQFQTFAQEFLGFFENRSTGILHKSKGFNALDTTPDRLRFQALIALETYWTLVRRVAEQRQIDHYREILDEGTRKAEEYLTQLGLDLPGVCLYFNKYTAIQYSPYSNVAFIGLPYFLVSAIDPDDRDWMAIPHELGHYVYWNLGYRLDKDGQNVWTLGSLADARQWQADLRNGVKIILEDNRENLNLKSAVEFNILQNNVLNWVEEIFADVVGTRLAGAEFIKSYEKLIVSRTGKKDDLKINDGT
ncbi:MAG: hypothetical protein GY797_17910, partial [Deltaproteobacteria bacterium]|nr:hypothetical protein [Deltaproteobacteria bacterium]